MLEWAYDLNGAKVPFIKELPIAAATNIENGQVCLLTIGTGVSDLADEDQDDAYAGVSVEPHDGSTAGRQSGTKIKLSVSPTAVYKLKPRVALTATGGSTTTFVDTNVLPDTDNVFNEGYLEIASCAADSTLVGRRVKITDYEGSDGTGTFTFTALPAAIASGDTAYLCPGPYAIGGFGWDLNADHDDINWESSGGESIQIVDVSPETFEVFVKLRLSQFGNHAAAL